MRSLLNGQRCVFMATIFDPISGRIAQELGFKAGLIGGSIASHAVLGAPDVIVLTLTELAEQVHRCTRASSVPLLVDGDHGYGNALNVRRTIEELDAAGAAAAMIEDTLLPRPYGPSDKAQLLSLDESVGKVKAAVAARGDSDLIVMGRTSAHAVTGIDDAIERLRAFENAGVDALFVPGLRSREELDRISAAVKLPIAAGGLPETMTDEAYLASRNVRLWARGHQTFAVAVQALHDAMKAVREGVPSSQLSGIASNDLMDRVTRAPEHGQWKQDFVGGKSTR